MDGLSHTSSTVSSPVFKLLLPSFSHPRRFSTLSFPRRPKKFVVFAAKDDLNLDKWDLMELKFGRMLGEDPKLTLAKIMSKKVNPEMSYLDVEKAFNKRKGKPLDIEEVPFDGSKERPSSNSLKGLNLVRPVPKKGVKFEVDDKPKLTQMKRPRQPVVNSVDNGRRTIPDVILRKPTVFSDDDVGAVKPRFSIKPNLSLKMGVEQTRERFTDMTLIRKPAPVNLSLDKEEASSGNAEVKVSNDVSLLEKPEIMNFSLESDRKEEASADQTRSSSTNDVPILEKPEMITLNLDSDQKQEAAGDSGSGNLSTEMENTTSVSLDQYLEIGNASVPRDSGQENDSVTGLQPLEQRSATNQASEKNLAESSFKISVEASLQGKPERLDSSVKGTSKVSEEKTDIRESFGNDVNLESSPAISPLKEREDTDWARAEDLVKSGGREEVELLSSSTRGFVVSFGSLIGFLPYRNLAAKWKYLAFESWLRRKGLDPSMYKQNLGVIGSYGPTSTSYLDSSTDSQIDHKIEGEISPDMKLEDLLMVYDQEKLKFLSSFVGQKIKVNVILADRTSRKLIFSVKPREKEESVEKKRSLMAKLAVGDVVKCCIKKITYFGIFVEVEGVPALIHQTEVSWDATLDPSYFKIGQIVEAKVHQLDFSLERIFLSLKEITPDPLIEALEAVVGDHDSLDGRLEAAQADTEWAEVDLLIKELQQFEGIQSVSKGRYFLSPGLAPTFQVYMTSVFENQYKLLARSGKQVQEVIVQTSLGKDEMKSAILTCTNRVA